jgi:DNA modification methylase
MPTLETNSVDMVLVDLPYGQTACEWDIIIDMEKMWIELKRICKDNATLVFFTTTKFGYKLIASNEKWFRYDLVWEKEKSVGYLSANKMPLRAHEMMYVFSSPNGDDVELNRNLDNRKYAESVFKYINKSKKQIEKDMGDQQTDHFFRFSSSQFSLPTKKTYDKLIELYKIDKMIGFKELDILKSQHSHQTYNPQKTEGKPWKTKAHKLSSTGVYGQQDVPDKENKTGDRHPLSIQKFKHDTEHLHPTQKPVGACEWLIKTYSNEGDTVLDFTMGSGSTGVACKNTNRNFIGIEMDEEIFKTAEKRINI